MKKENNSDDFYRPLKYSRIFTIHGMSDLEYGSDNRTFGWFETLKQAQDIVLRDGGIIHEECYDYVVVEDYGPGLYRVPIREYWYRWNFKKQRYMPIEKPLCFTRIAKVVGFGL